MSQVHALWTDNTVAANVRAELARHGLNANRLPKLLGSTQAYWFRRTRYVLRPDDALRRAAKLAA